MKYFLFFILLLIISVPVFSQDRSLDFYIVANGNFFLPGNSSEKKAYPILSYNKTTEPKVLVGGFGIGALAFKTINEKFRAKGQANFSKHAYWDVSQQLTGVSGDPLNNYSYSSSDYNIGLNATIHCRLTEQLMVGSGLGTHVLLFSVSRFPKNLYSNPNKPFSNNYYKRIMPVIPLEVSCKINSILLSIRYEQALLNKYRGELSDYKDERFCVLYFEIGFAL